ncbi:MAG: aminoglycoside phosphotransferase family protein [Bacteroidales bacterium]|nr:aminoglycoside phosphotransferase family protein [Bacteroidales bacterium]
MELKEIVKHFISGNTIKDIRIFGNGHINTTYKVTFENIRDEYILQKINTKVFENPQIIIQNHLKLQEHLLSAKSDIEIPHLESIGINQFLYKDDDKNQWRMMNFIKDSYSVEVVENENQSYEAGKGFGWFLKACSIINSSELHEAIKDFHSLSFRINQLHKAIEYDLVNRVSKAGQLISFYKERENGLLEIESSFQKNKIPLRVVHNDTKINNLLFRNERAVAVIDLDTVGPGVVVFDYGDAIRTITNTAAEDEKDLNKVNFDIKMFESFTKGYLENARSILNVKEKDLFLHAPFYMTFIMGIRFLTDYINGDIYYKTEYAEHNFVRTSVQKRLVEQIETNKDIIKQIIERYTI